MSDAKRIFLSYASENKSFAARLQSLMQDRGAQVFADLDLKVGDIWSDTIRREIAHADAFVLLLPSDQTGNRNSLWFEAGVAKALGKRVLAVRPPDTRLSDLPQGLADILILDADKRPLATIADTLIQAVPAFA